MQQTNIRNSNNKAIKSVSIKYIIQQIEILLLGFPTLNRWHSVST